MTRLMDFKKQRILFRFKYFSATRAPHSPLRPLVLSRPPKVCRRLAPAPLETSSVALTTKTKQPHSVAGLMLTTEVMITEIPEEKKEAAGGGHAGHSHGMEGMY